MLRRGFNNYSRLLSAAPCVSSLNTSFDNLDFWKKYPKNDNNNNSNNSDDLLKTIATATLDCLDASHIGSIDIATKTMKRWSEIDQADEITQLLAYNKTARSNLCQAIITHQQNTEFVAFCSRAITNMAFLMPEASNNTSNSESNNEVEHLKHFAENGVVDVLLKTLVKKELFDVVPSGRGAAWVLQALQNLIMKSDLAAEKCADYGKAERQRINPDSLMNAEHDELSEESTAEHALSVAVLRVLEYFNTSSRQLMKQQQTNSSSISELIELNQRVASASLDSGLASIARLLSMSVERQSSSSGSPSSSSETTIQHRSEFASSHVFRAVTQTMAFFAKQEQEEREGGSSVITLPSSPELDHKCWECLRQLVAVRENMAPLLSALHAADGRSGMMILASWLEKTKAELVPVMFSSSEQSTHEQRHQIYQRTLCGFDVLNELTNASTIVSSSENANTSADQVEYDHERQQLEEMGINSEEDQENRTSVSFDDDKTRRWESAMQSITSGTLSKFCVSLLTSLHVQTEENPKQLLKLAQDKELAMMLGEIKVKSLSLLLHLSQNDVFVRSANCIVVLQRSIIKPFLKLLAKKQSSSSNNNDEDYYYGSLLMCQQKTMSIIWNCLNFTDSLKMVKEMRIQDDMKLIVKFVCVDGVGAKKATPEEENLMAAGDKLLEKMRIVFLEDSNSSSSMRSGEGKSDVKK